MHSFEQGNLIDAFQNALLQAGVNVQVNPRGICNFVAVFDIFHLYSGNYQDLFSFYDNLVASKGLNLDSETKNKFHWILTKLTIHNNFTNSGKQNFNDLRTLFNLLGLFIVDGSSEKVKFENVGKITFKFDEPRITRLLSQLPNNIILQCSNSNHTIAALVRDGMIYIRDPNHKAIRSFALSDPQAASYIYEILGDTISFDMFGNEKENIPTFDSIGFITKEMNSHQIKSNPSFLNSVQERNSYGLPFKDAILLKQAQSAGHDEIRELLINDYGANPIASKNNLLQENYNYAKAAIASNKLDSKEKLEIIEYLLEKELLDINYSAPDSPSLLCFAMDCNETDVFKELLIYPNTNLHEPDKHYGLQPIDYAIKLQKEEYVTLLKGEGCVPSSQLNYSST
ncbi:Uncharacterised protein [Legionella lansingensis]|uniref:Ankyrin repeat-containing protein n=1 Tax=Legionella lansingensis TaxID=45067 RepID=A0A0W0VU04_9GAMM|nr:hypothetical protein [Legionella lansingensis]KTD23518.1 hypothetical protein Llan_0776 [Legionella lansingensis]SNV52068.1 Uncharacterised protein [Legionella lansingensis]